MEDRLLLYKSVRNTLVILMQLGLFGVITIWVILVLAALIFLEEAGLFNEGGFYNIFAQWALHFFILAGSITFVVYAYHQWLAAINYIERRGRKSAPPTEAFIRDFMLIMDARDKKRVKPSEDTKRSAMMDLCLIYVIDRVIKGEIRARDTRAEYTKIVCEVVGEGSN